MNKSSFYAALRADRRVFGSSLGQRQVEGMEALLAALRGFPRAHAAHVLGEVYHETGGKMAPVEESLYYTSASRIEEVFSRSRRQGIPGRELTRRPERLANLVYGGRWGRDNLGNTLPGDGWKFRGMGMNQCTGRRNAEKASALTGIDLVSHPEKMLDPEVSAKVAAEGQKAGMFTGKKLSDFDRPEGFDHYNARAIVNGDKAANGDKVALYAEAFDAALDAADWNRRPPVLPDVESVEAAPSGWGAFFKALMALFKR